MKRLLGNEKWTFFSPEEAPELHHLYGKAFDEKYVAYEQKAARGEIKQFSRNKAAALWRKMLSRLFETGHPWMTFKDPCNIRSPQDHVGVAHCSNLCTEITLNTPANEPRRAVQRRSRPTPITLTLYLRRKICRRDVRFSGGSPRRIPASTLRRRSLRTGAASERLYLGCAGREPGGCRKGRPMQSPSGRFSRTPSCMATSPYSGDIRRNPTVT